MTRPAPYPADTKAKGWRFELDYERIDQSGTWALAAQAGQEARPLLLMQWLVAWRQEPCGSLPSDEEVIAALIGINFKMWSKYRKVLMRGWWLADDGLLYHPTITARVLEMLDYRRKTAERVAKHKAAMREKQVSNALPTESLTVKNDTGTGTGTINTNTPLSPLAGGNPDEPESKPEDQPKARRQRKVKAQEQTLTEWLESLKAKGDKAIPPADPIFATASECGIPGDFVRYAWRAFRERHADSSKTYADWRAAFRNAVKGNWLKLWWVNPETDSYELTTAGHQVRIALENRNAEAAA